MFVSFKSGNTLSSLNSGSTYRLHPELQTRLIITLLPNSAGYQQSEYVYHVHACVRVYTVMCKKAGSILLLLRNKNKPRAIFLFHIQQLSLPGHPMMLVAMDTTT